MKQLFLFLIILFCFGCKPKIEGVNPNSGELTPGKIICIGDNQMSGFADDALYHKGQMQSLGNILAKQLQLVGFGDFNQPLIPANSVGVNKDGLSRLELREKTDCQNTTSLSPIRLASSGDLNALNSSIYNASESIGNWGIPGLKVTDVFDPIYSNPFYLRMQSSSGAAVIDELSNITSNDFAFFAVYIGLEDLLPHAKSGATSNDMTPTFGTSPAGDGFENSLSVILSTLSVNGAKGVISTIPDITNFPYFTAIPENGLDLDSANLETLNSVYNPIGFSFELGANNFMIEDPTANAFSVRPMLEGERLLLSVPLDSVKCHKMGSVFPFRDEFILTLDEISEIQTRIDEYNTVIRNLAQDYDLALVETKEWYESVNNGITYNGSPLNFSFVSGGTFSLDGVNLTGRGNALLCNEFIKSINKKYKAQIPRANAIDYDAVLFPQ